MENDKFGHRFDGSSELYNTATDATLNNQVLVSKMPFDGGGDIGDWQLLTNGTELDRS